MAVRLRVLKCYVWSNLLCGCETWTLTQRDDEKLGGIRTLVFKKNVESTLDCDAFRRAGHQIKATLIPFYISSKTLQFLKSVFNICILKQSRIIMACCAI